MTIKSSPVPVKDRWFVSVVLGGAAVVLVLWAGAAVSALVSGQQPPPFELTAPARALAFEADAPSLAWGRPMGPAWLYWVSTAVVALGSSALIAVAIKLVRGADHRSADSVNLEGLAARREVAKVAGAKALLLR